MLDTRPARPFTSVTDIIGTLFLPFFLVLTLLLVSGLVLAGNSGTNSRIEALTHSLVALNKAYQHAAPAARAKALNDLRSIATERHALLASLIVDDPGAALRVAVPTRVRAGMPEDVRAFIEQRPELEGELEVLYEDYEDGSARLRHFLKVSDKRISLHFKTAPPGLLSGTPVRASGILLDDVMALESGKNILTLAAGGGADGGSNGGLAAPVPNTFGEQRTAVLLVNFAALPEEPWTVEEARASVFGTVNDFFLENSFGQTWLSGDVFGWLTIDLDPAGCPVTDITIEANRAAGNQGINLSSYDRVIYAFPDIGCSWAGQATLGGSPARAWMDGTLHRDSIVSHELGHTFGLYHSHALECGTDVIGDNCLTAEYGDALDRMGNHSGGHFNAFQKARLGWLDYQASPPIVTAESSGLYQLEPYATQSQGAKAIRIPRDADPATGQPRWYFLEFRQASGFDSFLATSRYGASVTNGLVFRTGTGDDANSSTLLDITPNSLQFDWDDMALPLGVSYTDAASGTTIALEQVDSSGATVSVDFGTGVCIHRVPALVLSPSQGPWVSSGTPVSYAVTVTNNDSDSCGATGFDLSAVAPTGWSVQLDSNTLQISAGTSSSIDIVVTSPPASIEGFHDITLTASESDAPSYSASATATYVIEPADPTPICNAQTPVLSVSPGSQNANPGATLFYTVSLTNNDDPACDTSDFDLAITSLPGGWSGDLFPSSLSLSPGSTGTTTFSVTSASTATAGSYDLQIGVSNPLETTHAKTATATYVANDIAPGEDTQAPSTPTGLVASETIKQVNLSWNSSSDNKGVAGYQVWRDGAVIANTTNTFYSDTDLTDNVQYVYNIDAYDAAYNVSGMSDPVTAGKAKAKGKGTGGGKGSGKGNNK